MVFSGVNFDNFVDIVNLSSVLYAVGGGNPYHKLNSQTKNIEVSISLTNLFVTAICAIYLFAIPVRYYSMANRYKWGVDTKSIYSLYYMCIIPRNLFRPKCESIYIIKNYVSGLK